MSTKTKTYSIEGMTCSHCEARVLNALNQVEALEDVKINLASKGATVKFKEAIDDGLNKDAVQAVGYEVQ